MIFGNYFLLAERALKINLHFHSLFLCWFIKKNKFNVRPDSEGRVLTQHQLIINKFKYVLKVVG